MKIPTVNILFCIKLEYMLHIYVSFTFVEEFLVHRLALLYDATSLSKTYIRMTTLKNYIRKDLKADLKKKNSKWKDIQC